MEKEVKETVLKADNKKEKSTVVSEPVTIDLDYLNSHTIDRDAVSQFKDIEAAVSTGTSASVSVCCTQSGYNAKMAPLKYQEFFKMVNSEDSNYDSRKMVYKTIYDKIVETSIGDWKMTFEDWLKATSVYDMETLCYGIYCATYVNDGRYTFTCPHCKSEINITLDHNKIQHTADSANIQQLAEDIAKHSNSVDDLKKYSLVLKKHETLALPKSGIVFELRVPSLYDMLTVLKVFTDEEMEVFNSENRQFMLTIILSTASVFVKVQNDDRYSRITGLKDIYKVLNNLPIQDISVIRQKVISTLASNHVSYSIQDVKCTNPKCAKEIKFVPLDLEEILFAHIANLI